MHSINSDILGNFWVATFTILISLLTSSIIIITSDLSDVETVLVVVITVIIGVMSLILKKLTEKNVVKSGEILNGQTFRSLNELSRKLHDDLNIMSTKNPDRDKLLYAIDRVDEQLGGL